MAITSSASNLRSPVASPPEKKNRTKCPGVRVIGGRIYDSDNGMTCHQCRQKTRDFAAQCKRMKKDKPCSIKYCHKCLMNRYGEKAEEVASLDAWECPKCRGICNCSFCMKKRGQQPTGILVRTAKENGFSSVSELLKVKGPENFSYKRTAKDTVAASPMDSFAKSPIKPGKENSMDGKVDASKIQKTSIAKESTKKRRKGLQELNTLERHEPSEEVSKTESKIKKKLKKNEDSEITVDKMKAISGSQNAPGEVTMMNGTAEGCVFAEKEKVKTKVSKDNVNGIDGVLNAAKKKNVEAKKKKFTKSLEFNRRVTELHSDKINEDIPLPPGTSLVTVAGIELPTEVAGDALQFIEFCAAFGQALEFKKGQPEAVIREIVLGRRGRRLQGSLFLQVHVKLLSLILEDTGERYPDLSAENDQTSWLKALGECVANCNFMSPEFSSDSFVDSERYSLLNTSQKFKLLNFLCDEALSTNSLRQWIDDQNLKFAESIKKAKEKLLAAKDKKKQLKQRVQDEVAKAIMAQNGATLSLSEHQEIISQIKKEAALAQAEMLDAMGMMAPKRVERSDAVRTDPLVLDDNGRAFWRLKGFKDEPDILLQDMGAWDSASVEEKWFVYNAVHKEGIEKYISSLRTKRLRVQEAPAFPSVGDFKTNNESLTSCH